MKYRLKELQPSEQELVFRLDEKNPCAAHFIGYVRGDFGRNGNEFYTTWFPGEESKNTEAFKKVLDDVINCFRDDLEYPILHSFRDMADFCRLNPDLRLDYHHCDPVNYAAKVETPCYVFYIRLIVRQNDYNFYVNCYESAVTGLITEKKENGGFDDEQN